MTIFIISLCILFLVLPLGLGAQILISETRTPFERGFDPQQISKVIFSIHFFIIMVIFLLFEVELVLVVPLMETFFRGVVHSVLILFLFLFLFLRTLFEWWGGYLDWVS